MANVERHFTRRQADIRAAITGADGFEAAAKAVLELAAIWTPDHLAALLGDGMELAAWEGREAVFLDDDDPSFAVSSERLIFKEQIDFLRQKRPKPTRRWTDALHGDHDRAFVVAGVSDIAMLEEVQAALIKAAETGGEFEPFARDFEQIASKFGWTYEGDRNWRIRTILETNMRTSFMAGRLRQMRDPDVVADRPYWQYLHADSRIPLMPRADHLSWNGLILMWDDPWWDTHFPPNDWRCSCGVRTLSRRSLDRLGKTGPDEAPKDVLIPQISKTTGEMVMQPRGIGQGWEYMPGDHWDRGLVPSALLSDPDARLTNDPRQRHIVSIDTAEPITDLLAKARPFQSTVLPDDLPQADYIRALLEPLGQNTGQAVLFTDKAGGKFSISGEMFHGHDGGWKGYKRGHASHAALIAETLSDPDEIWLGIREVALDTHPGQYDQTLTRRYIKVDPASGLVVLFEIGRKHWVEITGYAALNRSKPDHRHIDMQRIGKLLWKRK